MQAPAPPSRFASPHWLATPPPPQIAGVTQLPQLTVRPPQPSATCPHVACAVAHVSGVQLAGGAPSGPDALAPQTFGFPPPPHVSGSVHVPHWMTLPQPSPCWPHVAPRSVHFFGTQGVLSPQTLGAAPPPHDAGAVQVPHWIVFPQPSPAAPHVIPSERHVLGFGQTVEKTAPSPVAMLPPLSWTRGGGLDPSSEGGGAVASPDCVVEASFPPEKAPSEPPFEPQPGSEASEIAAIVARNDTRSFMGAFHSARTLYVPSQGPIGNALRYPGIR